MIFIGLGNDTTQYAQTRHNAGLVVIEHLAAALGLGPWKAHDGVRFIPYGRHYLLIPTEFMNLSGQSIQKFLTWKHVAPQPEELLIIHDDCDFPLGTWKIQQHRSAAGHNGVLSFIETFGTKDFYRLRIGINRPPENMPLDRYVLQRFSPEELAVFEKSVPAMVEDLKRFIQT